jgi:hypothetical protein
MTLSELHERIRVYRPTVTIPTLRTTLLRLAHAGQVVAGRNADNRSTYALPKA